MHFIINKIHIVSGHRIDRPFINISKITIALNKRNLLNFFSTEVSNSKKNKKYKTKKQNVLSLVSCFNGFIFYLFSAASYSHWWLSRWVNSLITYYPFSYYFWTYNNKFGAIHYKIMKLKLSFIYTFIL